MEGVAVGGGDLLKLLSLFCQVHFLCLDIICVQNVAGYLTVSH